MQRLLAILVAALLPLAVAAAPLPKHKGKAAVLEAQDGVEPKLQSSQVLVFDPTTGQITDLVLPRGAQPRRIAATPDYPTAHAFMPLFHRCRSMGRCFRSGASPSSRSR